ncbi:hypothetical protein ACP70R_034817 [Stipagrostis hirtigluma subsp. patula]
MFSKSKKKSEEPGNGGGDVVGTAAVRKGPWTEEEDAQLVSGLRRTGKSCRLRWVNYLHPGLRRGRITPDEERLILQLHAQWGSRWSRIARSLPGRTDNEIKNYWRTRMRKKALEERRKTTAAAAAAAEPSDDQSSSVTSSGSGSSSGDSANCSATATASSPATESVMRESSGDEAEAEETSGTTAASQQPPPPQQQQQQEYCYTMEQLWNEIAAAEAAASYMDSWGVVGQGGVGAAAEPSMPASPVWESCSDYSLWRIDDEEYYKKMLDAS